MSWLHLAAAVEERARGRCEYCQMHQSLQGATFHLEHIVPETKGGSSELDNLAWACPSCNLRKSNRIELSDPDTNESVPMFDPRRDSWADHFQWDGLLAVGLTPIGPALIAAFDLNHPRRQRIRQAEQLFDIFPPSNI